MGDAAEMEGRALAQAPGPRLVAFPVEAVHQKRETLVAARIAHVGDADDRILRVG
ncbi:hypothetical protein D3C73_1599080 [compost metagenome]